MHVHFKIMSLTSGWQFAKGGKAALFCSWITVYDVAKGKKYSEDSHDTEAILAYYRVDKPFKRF